jgi:uncharacterized repeat protein (TIGR02543 family)
MKTILKKPRWFTVVTTLCLVVVTLFVASGCDKSETPPKHYTLIFAGEGVSIEPQSVAYGNYAATPGNPKREGYGFDGWFTDNGTFANKWDFKTDVVTRDTTLYAKWEKNTLQETTLQGTKWKLVGIGSLDKIALQELEPKDCEKCYTLTFDTDDTFLTFSSTNELQGIYKADYTTRTMQIVDFGGTKMNEIGDGILYVNPFWEMTIHSFSCKENELRLYYNENKNYLLFKSLEL